MNWWVINVETCLNMFKSLHKCLLMFVCWWGLNLCDCCEVWMKYEKIMGFGEKWTRWWIWGELRFWSHVCCCFHCLLMYVLATRQVLGTKFSYRWSKTGFWGENWRVHDRKPKNRASYSGAAHLASSGRVA